MCHVVLTTLAPATNLEQMTNKCGGGGGSQKWAEQVARQVQGQEGTEAGPAASKGAGTSQAATVTACGRGSWQAPPTWPREQEGPRQPLGVQGAPPGNGASQPLPTRRTTGL